MQVMTLEKIRTRLKEIESVKDDDERAHIWESELWADVLRHIALHSRDSGELAAEALRTYEIEFARWFA